MQPSDKNALLRPPSSAPARKHHYAFAHQLLPSAFFNDPSAFLAAVRIDGHAYLGACWDRVGSEFPAEDRLPREGKDCRFVDLSEDTTALTITMPLPAGVPEAYFVALLHCPAQADLTEALPRVITLERSPDVSDMHTACLCEWVGDTHRNFGVRPVLTLDGFVEAVGMLLM